MSNTDSRELAELSALVREMHKRLFGNGQPGELSAIKKRVSELEQFRWKVAGLVGGLVVLAEVARAGFEAFHGVHR